MVSTLDNNIRIEIREEFKSLFEYSLDFLFIYDFEGRILDVNDIVLKALGYSKEEVLKKTIFDFVIDEEMDQAIEGLQLFKDKGRTTNYNTFKIMKKNGDYLYLEVSGIPFKLKNNNKPAILGIGHDITLLKETEKELKISEKKYRSLFDESPIGIMLFDMKGNLIDRNSIMINNFPELLGIDFTGKNFREILSFFKNSDQLTKIFMERLRVLGKGQELEILEFSIDTKDGKKVWVNWQSSLVKVDSETYIQVLLHNITERKEAEKNLIDSEYKFHVLFNNSTSGIAYHKIVYNSNGVPIDYIITDVNPQFEKVLPFRKEDVINKRATEAYQVESAPFLDIYSRVADSQESTSFEGYFQQIKRHFRISVISLRKGEFITVFDDISELKEKYIELSVLNRIITIGNESTSLKEFLEKSYDQVLDIVGFDRGGVYLYNPETHHNFLVHHKNVHDDFLAAVEDVDISVGLFSKIFDKNNPFYIEDFSEFIENSKELGVYSAAIIPLRSKDKYVGSMNIGSPIHQILSDNELELLVAIGKQMGIIIQKFESERSLKESEEKFRTIAEQSFMGITIVQDDVISYANQAILDLFGYSLDEVKSWKPLEYLKLFPHKDREFILGQERKQQDEYDRSIHNYRVQFFKKNGESGWLDLFSNPIEYKGKLGGMVSVIDITDKMKAEQNLKESEEKFRIITEQSFLGIIIIQDNIIKYANEATEKITEYSTEELVGMSMEYLGENFFHPEDLPSLIDRVRLRGRSGEASIPPYSAYRVFTKSGELRWIEDYTKVILYRGKEALLVSIMDITEKKEAAQKLKESEEKFRTITEQSYMGILIMEDWSIKITYSNQKFADIIGYTREEIENWKIEDFFKIVHLEDVEDLINLAKKIYESEIELIENHQFRVFKKTGEIIWLEISTKSFPYGDGLAELISVIDITERILAEKIIKKSEKKYRHLFENAPYAIGLIDGKGHIIDFNETVSNFFPNYNKQDLLGIDIFEWISTANKDKIPLFRKLLDKINKGEITDSIEMQINRVHGDKIWINIHFSLLNIEDKTLIQLILQDITDKKEAEKLIIEENKKLLELDEIRKDMITRISHELKTPLTSIYGAIQILSESLRDQMNDNVLKFVDVIHRGSIRFKKLIENLLDISRMDSKKLELKAQQEDLSEIVDECVNEMIYLANNRDLKITLNLPHELIFKLDKLRIEQAITNLISNAIKNTPMNGLISISLLDYHEYIDIRIEDNGVGLTPEEKLKLFKKFGKIERYGMDLDVDIEGIGLGLFISKEIVELHGGKILVESEGRNLGTTFTIRLFKN